MSSRTQALLSFVLPSLECAFHPQHLLVTAVVPAISCARSRKEERLEQNDFSCCPPPAPEGHLLISLDLSGHELGNVPTGHMSQESVTKKERETGYWVSHQHPLLPC